MDGPSSKEKLETSLARRRANRLNDAIALVSKMEQNAALGLGLKKSDYKKVAAILKASTPISLPIKEAIIQQLQEAGAKATLCQGEADIGIRVRSRELRFSLNPREMVDVVAHDVDYCANKRIRNILRPYGKKYVKYDIDNLLADAGLTREQFKILLVVSHTDYSRNLPRLGIATNLKIIKNIAPGRYADMLRHYQANNLVVAAFGRYHARYGKNNSMVPFKDRVDFQKSYRIYIDGTETPLQPPEVFPLSSADNSNMTQVLSLKLRMRAASRLRRNVIKQQGGQTNQ
ncbi:hypothetical protein BGW41_008003, partial [Actinomortierella wolfii]